MGTRLLTGVKWGPTFGEGLGCSPGLLGTDWWGGLGYSPELLGTDWWRGHD